MNAQALTLPKTKASQLRHFDLRRDLLPVADLVELCFAENLDGDGRLYIRQMRQAASSPTALALATAASGRGDLPMSGFVWVEGGSLVGNLSLIPHHYGRRRLYLMANVAVHPNHRRRGIARALTEAALQEVERRGGRELWLQADETNLAAVQLYRGMGFTEKMSRTSWRARPQAEQAGGPGGGIRVRERGPSDWPVQQSWLKENYPADVTWQLPLDLKLLQPGWRGSLERALSERRIVQWSAERNGELLGVLSWQSSSLETDRLWLATGAQQEDEIIPQLMHSALAELEPRRNLALNYPGGRATKALQAAGFHAARTLVWMSYPWKKNDA
jgi:ribosomal protein S18 acetylase RimI-like enzyme